MAMSDSEWQQWYNEWNRDLKSFHFVFEITISNYYFIKTCLLAGCQQAFLFQLIK